MHGTAAPRRTVHGEVRGGAGFRRTIASPVRLEGTGLHLGHRSVLRFIPGDPGSGVRFRRVDFSEPVEIAALAESAELTQRRTQLGSGEAAVHTVEHVLAAVVGLGVHDLVIELNAPEAPIMDGSAQPFLEALLAAGLVDTSEPVQLFELKDSLVATDGESRYEAHPSSRLELEVAIDFAHPLIGR